MIAEIGLNEENRLELYVVPQGDTESMLTMYGELFGLRKKPDDTAWRCPASNGVVSTFKDATISSLVTSSARKP